MEAPRHRPRVSSVVTVLAVLVVAFGGLLTAAPHVAATTYVRGPIIADTTWGSSDTVYVLTRHVIVVPGVTLTILPGTTVRVDPMRSLFVEGRLIADGTVAKPITWVANSTVSLFPPMGVQFNASATGSVSWSTFDGFDRPLQAFDSSPNFSNNVITTASVGIGLVRSAANVADNKIRGTQVGIAMGQSSPQVLRNAIDVAAIGIQAGFSGAPYIASNQITNVTSSLALGIYIQRGVTADLWWNTVRDVKGTAGANAPGLGTDGGAGSFGAGILVDSALGATLIGNTIDQIRGGLGGDGGSNPGSTGGRGGDGGFAGAVIIGATPTVAVTGNIITNLYGGRGGNGGGSGMTVTGGDGGNAGGVAAIELLGASASASAQSNSINGVTGGIGGNGGDGTGPDGRGGLGGDANGVLAWAAMNADLSGNFVQNVRGGYGGNSTSLGLGNARGGNGAGGTGLGLLGTSGSSLFHSNVAWGVTGGGGGRGATGGNGGNATGVLAAGNADGMFNATMASANTIIAITGGTGGIGARFGGSGQAAVGIGAGLVIPTFARNSIQQVRGGNGGDALDGTDGGRGGDASGAYVYLAANGWSSEDRIDTVAKGAVGVGPPVQASVGAAWTLMGNATFTTAMTIENGTFGNAGDLDLQVNDFVAATTVNTTFSEARLTIAATSTLTVRNFLGVDAFWPNGATLIPGASLLVTDEGNPVWNFVTATGRERWLLVTDRVYEGSIPARDNRTEVTVTYSSYSFTNDPRTVDMAVTHTEPFVMVDRTAPVATARPLPAYENAVTFSVPYNATDGNGAGLGNVTLWFRKGGGWTWYATQAIPGSPDATSGFFSFTASAGDGTYEFAATAEDIAGNQEGNPTGNESWTVLDTVRPGSHVDAQPTWRNTTGFVVSWRPDSGVTDIASYTVQYNHAGSGWTDWLVQTTQTAATFIANPTWGVYEFRSIAYDTAGNAEVPPATNDTWTIVDVEPPSSAVLALPTYETRLSFPVSWDRVGDAYDIATFRVEVNDDGAGWTVWIASTANRSANFSGVDGHTYQFLSLATDNAGNVEARPSGNDTWTVVDATPPDSTVAALPPYKTTTTWTLTWGPVAGTSDIATYSIEYREGSGLWTPVPDATGTASPTVPFSLGADGHTFAFRSLATDRAGNVEPGPVGNDTWTIVDTTPPSVEASAPRGTGTNTTPLIEITFSEPMNRASAEAAFSITPDINGAFSWNANSRTLTFTSARPLDPGTTYFVAVDSSAGDMAGNTMAAPTTFQFSTAAASGTGPGSGGIMEWWWLLAVVVAAIVGSLLVAMRVMRSAPAPGSAVPAKKDRESTIEDVFLLYHDGILIKHETRRLKPDIDTDILSGMLTAVQSFVKDSFRTEEGELDELTFGAMHILIARGKWLILAAMIQGDGNASMREQIEKCIQEMEAQNAAALESWDGNMTFAKVLSPFIKKLVRGEYQ